MLGFHQRFIGARSFPKNLTDIDVGLCFRLSAEDVAALKNKYKENALGPAVLLVFLRAAGRSLESLNVIPAILLKYLCAELGVKETSIATMRTLYRRPATLTAHKQWILENLAKLSTPEQKNLDQLEEALKALASTAVSADDLAKRAELWLVENKLLIPGDREINSIANRAFQSEVSAAIEVIRAKVPPVQLKAALQDMFRSRKGRTGGTVLEWLKEQPGKHGLKSIREAGHRISHLKSLGVHQWEIDAIGAQRIRAYARAVTHRPPSATKALSENTQVLEITCFLRATLLEFTDDAFYTAGRQLNRMMAK